MAGTRLIDLATAPALTYNGFEFNAARRIQLQGRNEYDSAGRTVIGTRYTLSVRAIIWADDAAAQALNFSEIRGKLSEPQQELIIAETNGFGPARVGTTPNSGGGGYDLAWGPKPLLTVYQPIAGGQAWDVSWTCEYLLTRCPDVATSNVFAGIMEFNTSIEYALDVAGITTRVVNGHIVIPQTFGATTTTIKSAEDAYDRVQIPVPAGFARVNQARQVSEDRNRVSFSIVDQELDRYDHLPSGIAEGSIVYSMENEGESNFMSWVFSVSASLRGAPGTPRAWGFQKFLLILQELKQRALNYGPKGLVSVVPLRLRMSADKISRRSSMSASLRLAVSGEIAMRASGMFEALPGASYEQWAASMRQSWERRGFADLKEDISRHGVFNLCEIPTKAPGVFPSGVRQPATDGDVSMFGCDNITPETSWLDFNAHVKQVTKQQAVVHYPVQDYEAAEPVETDFGKSKVVPSTPRDSEKPSPEDAILQTLGAPRLRIVYYGSARRAKFRPVVPELTSWGGQRIHEVDRDVTGPSVVGRLDDCNIYALKWAITYEVLGEPNQGDEVKEPESPLPGGGAEGTKQNGFNAIASSPGASALVSGKQWPW